MNSTASGADLHALKERIVDFVRSASMEITPHDEQYLPELETQLGRGAVVYVAHTPKVGLQDVVRTACTVQGQGFRACPHVAARRLQSEADLRAALGRLRDAGCDRILLIAGDSAEPSGPYPGTLEVLASGAMVDCGIGMIAIAGHPEGNPNIGPAKLWEALAAKQAFAKRTGASVYVVTQFGFNVPAIIAWGRQARERGIDLPVHVGLAGPAPLNKLIRYAMLCGIGASLRAAVTHKNLLMKLTKAARSAEEVVTALVRNCTDTDRKTLIQPHFFPFGGSVAAARWIRAVRDGRFDLKPDGTGFSVRD